MSKAAAALRLAQQQKHEERRAARAQQHGGGTKKRSTPPSGGGRSISSNARRGSSSTDGHLTDRLDQKLAQLESMAERKVARARARPLVHDGTNPMTTVTRHLEPGELAA